ncbi:MAG: hypothetical protein ACXW29_13760 [Thermoanaerobaculia bacterium]
MNRKVIIMLAVSAAFTFSDCISQVNSPARRRAVGRGPATAQPVIINDDFRNGQLGWEAGFADYSPAMQDMNLDAGIRALPPELGIGGTGFLIGGDNHSDDLFMFVTKKLTAADGVRPNQRYDVTFRIVFASNAGNQCGGIGGSPGTSVFLKAGAAGEAPRVDLDSNGDYRLNLDIGNQAEGGANASVAGDISIDSSDCRGNAPYQTVERLHRHPFTITSNAAGEIWLLAGTDSGFEGRTVLYYQSIAATLEPVP